MGWIAASAVADAIAASILLFGAPFPRDMAVPAAAVSRGIAVLCLFGLARARPSRRWLCIAAVLAVPFGGTAVAAAAIATRGRGASTTRRRRSVRRRPHLTLEDLKQLAGALPPCDALERGDAEHRRAALSALSRRGDAEAIAVLRWAAARCDSDVALSAALALDRIGERAERRGRRSVPAGARHGTG
jgi:hypothetical protein